MLYNRIRGVKVMIIIEAEREIGSGSLPPVRDRTGRVRGTAFSWVVTSCPRPYCIIAAGAKYHCARSERNAVE